MAEKCWYKRVIFITGAVVYGKKIGPQQPSGGNPKEHCDTTANSKKMLWDGTCHGMKFDQENR